MSANTLAELRVTCRFLRREADEWKKTALAFAADLYRVHGTTATFGAIAEGQRRVIWQSLVAGRLVEKNEQVIEDGQV